MKKMVLMGVCALAVGLAQAGWENPPLGFVQRKGKVPPPMAERLKLIKPAKTGEFRLVPTYVSCSMCWGVKGTVEGLTLEYRAAGAADWRTAEPPMYFDDAENYRGSILDLAEDTAYEARLVADGRTLAEGKFRTWKSDVPIAKTVVLDPKTAMNPNLNFGQAIPGRCKGRGIGLIDTRLFVTRLLDAIAILERTGDLPKDDLSGLKAWFGNYLDWMLTSPIGLDEQDEHNNHGTAYDLQAAGLAWFVGRTDLARKILQEDTKKRIASQIQPDGSQPHELARTRALTYATMNATLFCELALLGEKVGVDLWRYETADGRSIRKAVEWLMPYWRREKAWTLKQITPIPPDIGRDASAIYSRHFKVSAEPMRQATGGCDTPIMAGLESLRSLAADRGYEITAVDSKPDFVKVAYVLRPSAESFIRCELALPAGREWDGRLWGFGNGGGFLQLFADAVYGFTVDAS